ncbi:MAG: hypothetical protein RBT36_11845, partial [Desulfobulbus sp.]|nr:hypothetical protein [Desulfobulbus sp.]
LDRYDNVVATVTLHHLLITLDDVAGGLLRPDLFYKPIAKIPRDRETLLQAVFAGHPRLFFGSDSASTPATGRSASAAPPACSQRRWRCPGWPSCSSRPVAWSGGTDLSPAMPAVSTESPRRNGRCVLSPPPGRSRNDMKQAHPSSPAKPSAGRLKTATIRRYSLIKGDKGGTRKTGSPLFGLFQQSGPALLRPYGDTVCT